jgi:hypothetical protein
MIVSFTGCSIEQSMTQLLIIEQSMTQLLIKPVIPQKKVPKVAEIRACLDAAKQPKLLEK